MKIKPIIFGLFLIIFSCDRDNTIRIEEQILGKWELTSTMQLKNESWLNVQPNNSYFEFKKNKVVIEGKTFLENSGEYSYTILKKNYFDNNASEPKSDILEFNNKKYVIEIGTYKSKKTLTLMNYTDGKIYFRLEQ